MPSETFYDRYEKLYVSLRKIIQESEKRCLESEPDKLFSDNVNFYVKSYMISICTYLEAYLQDIAYWHSDEINSRLRKSCIPHNFIYWKLVKETKDKELKFEDANLPVTKSDISDKLSANPYKTIKMFSLLGVDLCKSKEFQENKELVGFVVAKRNNIIHHNDKAMDVSFSDLLSYIDAFLRYMKSIDVAVNKE